MNPFSLKDYQSWLWTLGLGSAVAAILICFDINQVKGFNKPDFWTFLFSFCVAFGISFFCSLPFFVYHLIRGKQRGDKKRMLEIWMVYVFNLFLSLFVLMEFFGSFWETFLYSGIYFLLGALGIYFMHRPNPKQKSA